MGIVAEAELNLFAITRLLGMTGLYTILRLITRHPILNMSTSARRSEPAIYSKSPEDDMTELNTITREGATL